MLTEGKFVSPRTQEENENLRRDFVEAAQRPLLRELAEKHKIPLGTVARRCSEEKWHEARAAFHAKADADADARALVIQAMDRTSLPVMRAFVDVLVIGLEGLGRAVAELGDDLKASTRLQAINTASFAFQNFANGAKAVGLVSFDRNLAALGKEDNGRWNPQMLHQLNVTVQNITKEAEAAKAKPADTVQDVE